MSDPVSRCNPISILLLCVFTSDSKCFLPLSRSFLLKLPSVHSCRCPRKLCGNGEVYPTVCVEKGAGRPHTATWPPRVASSMSTRAAGPQSLLGADPSHRTRRVSTRSPPCSRSPEVKSPVGAVGQARQSQGCLSAAAPNRPSHGMRESVPPVDVPPFPAFCCTDLILCVLSCPTTQTGPRAGDTFFQFTPSLGPAATVAGHAWWETQAKNPDPADQ